jgi:hypothetical protein
MAAARPGWRLGNRFQKERERGDEQRNQEQRFSHGIASADARQWIVFKFIEAAFAPDLGLQDDVRTFIRWLVLFTTTHSPLI